MAKKNKKRVKRAQMIHAHQHEDFMEHIIEEGEAPRDRHVFPDRQPWHQAKPWCWCRPEIVFQHPINFKRVYTHRLLIH